MNATPIPAADAAAQIHLVLLISDPALRSEVQQLLGGIYGGFLVINEAEKVAAFSYPIVLISDTVKDIAEISHLPPPEGSRLVALQSTPGSEAAAAAFVAGADDCVRCPLNPEDFLRKVGHAMEGMN